MPVKVMRLEGERFELALEDSLFPKALKSIPHPPARLYGVGRPGALAEGLAVVGARRATPYGRGCAKRFAAAAAERGVAIISGGARGCDAVAHEAALAAGAPTVAFLGGGCNQLYPAENAGLFQRIVAAGGAVVSEHEWDFPPQPHTFRARNRPTRRCSRAGRYGWCPGPSPLRRRRGRTACCTRGRSPLWTTKPSPTRSSQPSVV